MRALGYDAIERFHMNEGHAALLTLELLREHRIAAGRDSLNSDDVAAVRSQCVFTTHTPVPAGHDKFDLQLADRVLGSREACGISDSLCHAGELNMTYLALALSGFFNGVAKRHSEISQHMFAEYKIDAITNGVHAATWISPAFANLYDRLINGRPTRVTILAKPSSRKSPSTRGNSVKTFRSFSCQTTTCNWVA